MRALLLASFGGRQYGIWKDSILSVRDIHALHRIPLSPSRIAGIMIDDGQTVTLGDLPACIGLEPSASISQGCILLIADGERVAGFVVSGELRTLSISPGFVFPLPDYLETPVFDTCVVHDGVPIPVINIAELNSRVLKAGVEPSGFLTRIAVPLQSQDMSRGGRIRHFTAAGERYAVQAAGIDDQAAKPGPITPLPNTPRHVKGVTFHDGCLMTVIDLTQRIKRQSAAPEPLMLIARIADAAFGILIDSDGGVSPADKAAIKPLPLIAQSAWLKHVVVHAGELIPLVDLAMVLSAGSVADDDKPMWQRYVPASNFADIFFEQDAEVVEFSLLGERYALPKQEVEEVTAFRQCRIIPGVIPIVVGVAEYNGEILPVVDLAMMFGRRSLATPEWRMMLVKNGDFRALAITEAAFGTRPVPLDMHRTVPVHLPHNLMYGCYPDGNAVRIILNVEAISVHFEKSLIQKFMPALSHEMRISPTGVVYEFPGEKIGAGKISGLQQKIGPGEYAASAEKFEEEPQPSANGNPDIAEAEPVPEAVLAEETSPAASMFEQPAEGEATGFVDWEEADTAAPMLAAETGPIEIIVAADPSITREPLTTADEQNAGMPSEQEQMVSEHAVTPETVTAAAESKEQVPREVIPDRERSADGSKAHEPAASRNKSPLEEMKASARKNRKKKVSTSAAADIRPSEPIRAAAGAGTAEPYRMESEVERPAVLSGRDVRVVERSWKRMIAYGAIAAVLIAVFYFSGTPDNPVAERSAQGTGPAKMEQASMQPEQSHPQVPAKAEQAKAKADLEGMRQAETGTRSKQEVKEKDRQTLVLSPLTEEWNGAPRTAEATSAPLELDIPKSKPTDIDVYVVRQGDTLWTISERFTGSPYNYPRIAGENRIAEPDLIFPGQRIRLIK